MGIDGFPPSGEYGQIGREFGDPTYNDFGDAAKSFLDDMVGIEKFANQGWVKKMPEKDQRNLLNGYVQCQLPQMKKDWAVLQNWLRINPASNPEAITENIELTNFVNGFIFHPEEGVKEYYGSANFMGAMHFTTAEINDLGYNWRT